MATFDADGVEIFYEDLGSGEPLLVIHGAAASGRWFGDVPQRLATDRRVVMPDLRGLGRSQRIAPITHVRTWMEDMWCLLDALGLDRVDVVGCSLGSRIAGRLVLDNPVRVRSLIVDAPIIGMSAHGNASLNSTFGQVDEDSDQAREWAHLHGPDWRDVVAFYGASRSAPGFQDFYTLRDDLAALDVPTLICRGDWDDDIHPVDDAFVWHKTAPDTQLWIAPGLTQSSTMLERPAEFVAAASAFLARVGERAVA